MGEPTELFDIDKPGEIGVIMLGKTGINYKAGQCVTGVCARPSTAAGSMGARLDWRPTVRSDVG